GVDDDARVRRTGEQEQFLGLPPEYNEFANRLARRIRNLDSAEIGRLSALIENGGKGDGKAS
ncbi:hypothetical protein ACC690_39040, partial [Rhizobium johnstonii]